MTRLQSPQLAAPQQASSFSDPVFGDLMGFASAVDTALNQPQVPDPQQPAPYEPPPGLAAPDVGPWGDERAAEVFHSTADASMAEEALRQSSKPLSMFMDSIEGMWQDASPDAKANSFVRLMNSRAAQVAGNTLGDEKKRQQYADELEAEAQKTYPGLKVPKELFVKTVSMHEDATKLVDQWANQSHFDNIYSDSMELSRKYKDPEDRAQFFDIVRNTTKQKIGGEGKSWGNTAISNVGAGGSDVAGNIVMMLNSYMPGISRRDERADELDFMANLKGAGRAGAFEPPADRGFVSTGVLEAFRQLPAMAISTAGVGGGGPALASGGRLAAGARAAGAAYKAKGTIGAVRAGMAAASEAAPAVAAETAAAVKAAEAAAEAAPGIFQSGKAAWSAASTTPRAIGSSLGAAAKTAISKAPVEALRQTAFWTTQIAPDIEKDLVESGISRETARPAALITGVIEGALENLNSRQLLGPAIKKWGQGGLKRYFAESVKQFGKEWGEEFNQAATEVLGKAAAFYVDGKDFDWTGAWHDLEKQTRESAIPVGVMQGIHVPSGVAKQYKGGQQRYGDLLRADVMRQMDPATRKALKEGGEEMVRDLRAQQTGENINPLTEEEWVKRVDFSNAEAPADMQEAIGGRRRGERATAYQDRMKGIADKYGVRDKDAKVGSVKRFYDESSKIMFDFMRGQTSAWEDQPATPAPGDPADQAQPERTPVNPEAYQPARRLAEQLADQRLTPAKPVEPGEEPVAAEPDNYGWTPIKRPLEGQELERARISAAMDMVRQSTSGSKMDEKQLQAEAKRMLAEADEIVAAGEEAVEKTATAMYQDPRAAVMFYLFGAEDKQNPDQHRPDAGRHLAVAKRPEHAKTFEEHGLPALNNVRGARGIRLKFAQEMRKFSELPRGLVKEIARLAQSDTDALTADAGGKVKIDQTWRKYPAGSNVKGMVFHDTPFGRFGRRDIPGDVELTPFTYEEAGNWVASLQTSQNAPQSTQATPGPIVGKPSPVQPAAKPVAQPNSPSIPESSPAPYDLSPTISPELQAEMDKALQEGDVDKVVELMDRAQSQNETTSKPAPTPAPSATKPDATTANPDAKPAKSDAKPTKENSPLSTALIEKTQEELDSLNEEKEKLAAEQSQPSSPRSDLLDLMQSPKDWREAAKQAVQGATSTASQISLPDLYSALKAKFKSLTPEEFRRGLREMYENDEIILEDYSRAPDDVANNPLAIKIEARSKKGGIYDDWKFGARAMPTPDPVKPKITAKNPKPITPAPSKPKTAEDAVYEALPAPVQRVVDDLKKHAKDKLREEFEVVEEPENEWTALAMELAERVSGKTGTSRSMPVVWFRGNWSHGMVYKGVVFLNADLARPDALWGTIAHEVSHLLGIDKSLKFDDPDLMDRLRDEYYWSAPAGMRLILKSNDSLWDREAVAFLIDRLFRNPDFRRQMQQEKPTVWQKIVAAFRRLFERFTTQGKWDPSNPVKTLPQKHLDKIHEVFMGAMPTKVKALTTSPEVAPSKYPELDDLMLSPMKDVAQYLRDRYKSTSNEEKFFARYMQDALRALQVQVSAKTRKGNVSKAGIRKAVDKYMEDVSEYLEANPNLAEYYANEANRERAELVKVYPELAHDEVWAGYLMMNGMASAQTNLGENTQETIDVWAKLREKGEVPLVKKKNDKGQMAWAGDGFVVHGGPSSRNKINNYRAFNKLLKKHGSVGEVAAFLTGTVSREGLLNLRRKLGWATIGEIVPIMDTVRHATGQAESIPRMFVFGPKVGSYILNRMGNHRYQTIDVWESRLARFYMSDIRFNPGKTGLLEGDDRKMAQEFGKLVAEELGLDTAAAQAVRWYHFKGFVKDLGYSKVKDEDLKTLSEITAGRLGVREGDGGESSGATASRPHAIIRGSGRGVETRRRTSAQQIRDNLGSGGFGSTANRELTVQDDTLYLSPYDHDTAESQREKQKQFNKAVAKLLIAEKGHATYRQFITDLMKDKPRSIVLKYEQYLRNAWDTARAMLPKLNLTASQDIGSMFPATIVMVGEPASNSSQINSQASTGSNVFVAMDDDNEQVVNLTTSSIQAMRAVLERGGNVFLDLGSWRSSAAAEGKGWARVVKAVGMVIQGLQRGQVSRVRVILPDVMGNQTESHIVQMRVAGELAPLRDSGVTFVVPVQHGPMSIEKYTGLTVTNMPSSNLAFGIPIGGRQWSRENAVEYASKEADNAAITTRIHLMGVDNRLASSIASDLQAVNPKAEVTAENSARHRGDDDHLEGIGDRGELGRELRKLNLKLKKEGDSWVVTEGKGENRNDKHGTFNNQDWLKNIGGVWSPSFHGYRFEKDPRQDIYNHVTRRRRELEEKKRIEASKRDLSVLSRPATDIVSKETQDAINAGKKIGVADKTLEGQIEDIARVSEAIDDIPNRKAFILAAGTGTGKTFVLGGVVKEALNKGFTKVIWVTKNPTLIAQAKDNISVFGVDPEKVEFITYSTLSKKRASDTEGALLIFDESQEINNFVPDTDGVDDRKDKSKRAVEAQGMIKAARFTVFSSATPILNPVQAGYIAASGVFDLSGGFVEWAQIYGAALAKTTKNTDTVVWQKGGRETSSKVAEARSWLLRRGIFSRQPVHLPDDMVITSFRRAKLSHDQMALYTKVQAAYEAAGRYRPDLTMRINRYAANSYKRLTEYLKVPAAIERVKQLVDSGKQVVVFTPYKSATWLGRYEQSESYRSEHNIPKSKSQHFTAGEVISQMEAWKQEAAFAKARKEKPPTPPFAEEIWAIAQAMKDLGIDQRLESTFDLFADAFSADDVGYYAGAFKGDKMEVKSGKAKSNDLQLWMKNKKKVLVSTISAGGTGLSLHDTTGKMPIRVQVGIALPWTGYETEQTAGRLARGGIKKKVGIEWLFAEGITFEKLLASKVGRRLTDMGAMVNGIESAQGSALEDFDFEDNFDPTSGGVASELPTEIEDDAREDLYGEVQEDEEVSPEKDGREAAQEGESEEGDDDGVDEGVTELGGFKIDDLVEYADPGDMGSTWIGSVVGFKGDSAWVATENSENLIPLSWMEHLEDTPSIDDIPVDKPTPPPAPVKEKAKSDTLFEVERPETSRIFSIDPQKVSVAPGMQFKKNADKEGVTERDKIGEEQEWDETLAGTFLFWQDNAGKVYVADGHHRLAHAKKVGAPLIHGYLRREQDGYSFQAARAHAALINIKNDKGTIYDHAAFFRDSEITETKAQADGLFRKVMARTGFLVGRFASDPVYEAFINEDITPEKAAVIAEVGKDNLPIQAVGLKWAKTKRQTAEVLRESLRIFRDSRAASEGVMKKAGKLKQLSIFEDYVPTDDELDAEREADAIASVVVKEKAELRETIRRHTLLLNNPESARKQDVSFNEQTSRSLIEVSNAALDEWEHVGTDPGLYEKARMLAGLTPRATDGLGQEVASSYGGGGGTRTSARAGQGSPPANQPSTNFPFTPSQVMHPMPLGMLYDLATAMMGSEPELKRMRKALGMAIHKEMLGVEHMRILVDPKAAVDPDLLRKVLAHEIGHIDDVIDPNSPLLNTIKRGNVVGRIHKLRGFRKNVFMGTKNSELRQELVNLTEWWSGPIQGAQSYIRYRKSSEELFAEFISVFLVSPGEAKSRAPDTYAAFLSALDKHEPMKRELIAIQAELAGSSTAEADRFGRVVTAMHGRGQDTFLAHRKMVTEKIYRPAASVVIAMQSLLLDSNAHGQNMAAEMVKAKQLTAYEEAEYRATIDDLHHKNAPGNADLRRHMEYVTKELEAANIPRMAYDNYMFALRVQGDESRQNIANPKGTDEEAAYKYLQTLPQELGSVKWAKLEAIGRNASDMMFDVFERGYKAGLFTDEMMDQAKRNRYKYMPFIVMKYYNGWVHPGVMPGKGTWDDTAPASESIPKKILAMERAIIANTAVRETLKLGAKSFGYHARRLQTDNLGNILPSEKINSDINEIQWVYENGKKVPYEVDAFIAEMFKTHELRSLQLVTNAMSNVIYSVWHPLFVTYSMEFLARNIFRDVWRTTRDVPTWVRKARKDRIEYLMAGGLTKTQAEAATKDMKVSSFELLFKRYAPTFFRSIVAVRSKDHMYLEPYMRAGIINESLFVERPSKIDLTDKTMELDKMYQEGGIQAIPPGDGWRKKMHSVMESPAVRNINLFRWVKDFNKAWEVTSKITSADAMRDAGLNESYVRLGARKYSGTPDFNQRGTMTGPANAISMYFKVKMVGLASDIYLARKPGSALGWWMRIVATAVMPAFINAMLRKMVPGYDDAEDRLSEYMRKNYLCLFWPGVGQHAPTDKNDTEGWKQGFISIPMDDMQRFVHNVSTNLFDWLTRDGADPAKGTMWKMLKKDLDAAKNAVMPSYNPAITMANGWSDFMTDTQPLDPLTNKPIIPDRQWDLRDEDPWPAVQKMGSWTIDQFGVLSTLWKSVGNPITGSYEEEPSPWYKSTWKLSGAGALFRSTDRGMDEKEWAESQLKNMEGAKFRAKLNPTTRKLSGEFETLRDKPTSELSDSQKSRRDELRAWMNGTYNPIRQAIQSAQEIGLTDQEVKDLYSRLNATAGSLEVLDADTGRNLKEQVRLAKVNDDLGEPITTRDVGGKVAGLLDQKMYLTRRESEEAAKMGVSPGEAFRRIQAQMYSDRKVTKAWLKARGITPQQALDAYQVYAHERAANTRRKDGTPGRVDPESLRRSVLRLAGELQQP